VSVIVLLWYLANVTMNSPKKKKIVGGRGGGKLGGRGRGKK
jgi:hypothetical protein